MSIPIKIKSKHFLNIRNQNNFPTSKHNNFPSNLLIPFYLEPQLYIISYITDKNPGTQTSQSYLQNNIETKFILISSKSVFLKIAACDYGITKRLFPPHIETLVVVSCSRVHSK